jgi:hypothetical protein
MSDARFCCSFFDVILYFCCNFGCNSLILELFFLLKFFILYFFARARVSVCLLFMFQDTKNIFLSISAHIQDT